MELKSRINHMIRLLYMKMEVFILLLLLPLH